MATPQIVNSGPNYNKVVTMPLGGIGTLQAPNTASNYTTTGPTSTGTAIIAAVPQKITYNSYLNYPALGDVWFDSTTQAFDLAPGLSALSQDQYLPGILYALKVPAVQTAAKYTTYATLLTTAAQTYSGTNILKANYLTVGKQIRFRVGGVMTIIDVGSMVAVKLRIGGADITMAATGTLSAAANLPFLIEGVLSCTVLGTGANSTVYGWVRIDVLGNVNESLSYGTLATVNATGTLVLDVLVTTAQDQNNTFTPYFAIIESRG